MAAGDEFEVRLVGDLVDRLLHLESTIQDLKFALRSLVDLRQRMQGQPEERRPVDEFDHTQLALWNASTVAYARCFVGGLRYAVAMDLVPADLKKVHADLIKLRGEHIAHFDRKSNFESVTVSAVLRETPDSVVINIRTEGVKTMQPTVAAIDGYVDLVQRVHDAAEGKYQQAVIDIEAALTEITAIELLRSSQRGAAIRLGT